MRSTLKIASVALVGAALLAATASPPAFAQKAAGETRDNPGRARAASPGLDPSAYLDLVLSELELRHLARATVDWRRLKAEARRRARRAVTVADTYPAIRYVIEALGEKHTTFVEPPRARPVQPATLLVPPSTQGVFRMPEPAGKLIDGRFGYLRIPGFAAPTDHPDADLFIAMARRILLNHDRAGVCGWVIDLRGNTGGTIWNMADGLLPLLLPLVDDGPYWFFDIDGKVSPVTVAKGRLTGEGAPERPALETRTAVNAQRPIAVLVDNETASAGEGVALIFKGLPNARLFGEATADLVTVNNPVRLPDGASISMTVGYLRDRDGNRQIGPILPDELATSAGALEAGRRWLTSSCPNVSASR